MEVRFIFDPQEEFNHSFWEDRTDDVVTMAEKLKLPPITLVTFVQAEYEAPLLSEVK